MVVHSYCMYWCLLMLMFFFFKQKTAYEMRISDWSSDVCSSDLNVERARMFKEIGDVLDFHNLCVGARLFRIAARDDRLQFAGSDGIGGCEQGHVQPTRDERFGDRKSTRLNSSH